MKKSKAYKVVSKEDNGRLMSLYNHILPSHFTVEYSTEVPTHDHICFVCKTRKVAEAIACYFCTAKVEVWECEGFPVRRNIGFKKVSTQEVGLLGLLIDEESYFMTEVRLLRKLRES